MYRCLECNTVFNIKPDYCDCGNDTFDSVQANPLPTQDSQVYYSEPATVQVPVNKKPTDIKALTSNIIFGLCILLSILAWLFIGNNSSSSSSKGTDSDINASSGSHIPDISQVWDSTPPAVQKQIGIKLPTEVKKVPILNSRMATLGPEMRTYVLSLGQTFVSNWPRGSVVGDGSCEIEFIVDTTGKINGKKILKPSNNSTMDESIKLMLENVTQVNPPPAEYQEEKIIMAFSIQNRAFKVYYPQY